MASLATRIWSGSYSDAKGGKRSVVVGLIAAAAAGLLYLLSLAFLGSPIISVAFLLVGRAVLGCAESFIITGGVNWGLAMAGSDHAGKVIAWVGTAMFAALAFGGPLGTILFATCAFAGIAVLTTLLPLLVLLPLLRAPSPPKLPARTTSSFRTVIRAVWLPGVGAAFSSIGYAAILAFSSLLYANHGWQPIWLAFTVFGVALIVARMMFGHLPDKLGGARIALVFVLIQSAGLILMGLAGNAVTASAGAALAGLGYSLVYPGLGVEAVRGTPPESRGLAMGIYTVCLDVAMALGSPALGWVADREGLSAAFIVSAGLTLGATAIAVHLIFNPRGGGPVKEQPFKCT